MWKVSFLMLRISFSLNPTAAVAVVALEPLKSFDREVTDGCVRSCAALVWALWLRHQSRTQERKIRLLSLHGTPGKMPGAVGQGGGDWSPVSRSSRCHEDRRAGSQLDGHGVKGKPPR